MEDLKSQYLQDYSQNMKNKSLSDLQKEKLLAYKEPKEGQKEISKLMEEKSKLQNQINHLIKEMQLINEYKKKEQNPPVQSNIQIYLSTIRQTHGSVTEWFDTLKNLSSGLDLKIMSIDQNINSILNNLLYWDKQKIVNELIKQKSQSEKTVSFSSWIAK